MPCVTRSTLSAISRGSVIVRSSFAGSSAQFHPRRPSETESVRVCPWEKEQCAGLAREARREGGAKVSERLEGTVALVTGASSGIGEATARLLAARGAALAIAARRKDRLERLAGEIESKGGRALVIEADVTDRAQAIAAVERTVAELGRLDTLVNNAGVMLLGPALDAPLEEWE